MSNKLDGLVLAQNKKRFKGYTVFDIPFESGDIEMMSYKDVQAILEKYKESVKAMLASLIEHPDYYYDEDSDECNEFEASLDSSYETMGEASASANEYTVREAIKKIDEDDL